MDDSLTEPSLAASTDDTSGVSGNDNAADGSLINSEVVAMCLTLMVPHQMYAAYVLSWQKAISQMTSLQPLVFDRSEYINDSRN